MFLVCAELSIKALSGRASGSSQSGAPSVAVTPHQGASGPSEFFSPNAAVSGASSLVREVSGVDVPPSRPVRTASRRHHLRTKNPLRLTIIGWHILFWSQPSSTTITGLKSFEFKTDAVSGILPSAQESPGMMPSAPLDLKLWFNTVTFGHFSPRMRGF